MKTLRKLILWFWMLSKRLYKKPTFLVLIMLIPVFVVGYRTISGGESGILTVGLTGRGEDPMVREIFADLQANSAMVTFRIYEDPQEAENLLRSGKLDTVWIFPEDMAQKIEAFTRNPTSDNAFITVLEREDNVSLMLVREKLSSAVFPYLSERIYVHFLRDLAPEWSGLSDAQLLEYYHGKNLDFDLFEFTGAAAGPKETNYLLSPLRGLLGTLILLCALATAMYGIRDQEKGTFGWVSKRWRFLPELGCHLTAALHIAAVCLMCLALSGLAGSLWTELAVLLMYSLCCSVFAMAMAQVFGSVKSVAMVLPLIMVAALVICPVFFDLGFLRRAQYILPPTYYINAVYNSRYLLDMGLYTALFAALAFLIRFGKKLLRRS